MTTGIVNYPGHHLHNKRVKVVERRERVYCGQLNIGPLYVVRHPDHPGMDYGLPVERVRVLAESEGE